MEKTVRLSISSKGAETDAPTVDELLDQVRDYFGILRDVEGAIAGDGEAVIDWRIVWTGKNSPIALEAQAFSRNYGVNIDLRAEQTVKQTALGLASLQISPERPAYFTEKALSKAESLFERVTNGLALTRIDHGLNLPVVLVTPESARIAARNTSGILRPDSPKAYKEIGAVEGYYQSVGRDGHGRIVLNMRYRLTGDTLKCILHGNAKEEVESHTGRDILSGRRIEVAGLICYKSLGLISQVEAYDIRFLRDRDSLPSLADIEDENFTAGMRSEDYLEMLRDGEISYKRLLATLKL